MFSLRYNRLSNSERAAVVDKLVKHTAPQSDEVESIEFPLIVDSLMWVNCCSVTTVLSMCPWNAIHHANGVHKCLIRLQSDVNKCFAVLDYSVVDFPHVPLL